MILKITKIVFAIVISLVSSQMINYYFIDEVLYKLVNPSLMIGIGTRIIIATILGFLILILLFPRMKNKRRKFCYILSGVYILGLVVATFRSNVMYASVNLIIGETIFGVLKSNDIWLIISNIVVNILVPIPLPIAIYVFGIKHKVKNLLFSVFIFIILEFVQLLTGRGIFDIDDIILTSIGVLIGVVILFLYDRVFNRSSNYSIG